jgi:rubredoxin
MILTATKLKIFSSVTAACAKLAKSERIKDNKTINFTWGYRKMEKWKCTACGFIYDPEIGDPDSGVAPGTPFEQLPEDWSCPVCGVSKDMFEKM